MKTILVTGGNRGIGLEICRQLDELDHIVILGSRTLNKGKTAAQSFSKNVIVKQLDVTDEESVRNLFEFLKNSFGKLDVLINNAGIGTNQEVSENTVLFQIKNKMETKFFGAWRLVRVFIPLLRKAGIIAQKKKAENISFLNVKHIIDII